MACFETRRNLCCMLYNYFIFIYCCNCLDVAEEVFNRCMTDNKESLESYNYKITFNYEFLDDLYSVLNWSEKGSSDSGSSSGKNLQRSR